MADRDRSAAKYKGYDTEMVRRRIRRERLTRESPILRGWAELSAWLHLSTPAVKQLAAAGALPLYTNKLYGRHQIVAFRDEVMAAYREHVLADYTFNGHASVARRVTLQQGLRTVLQDLAVLLGRTQSPPSPSEWHAAGLRMSTILEQLIRPATPSETSHGKFQRTRAVPKPHRKGRAGDLVRRNAS